MPLYELIERPDPRPLVLALGRIDARLAAAGAAEVLCDQLDTITVARFGTDELLDYQARRPIAHLDDGVPRGMTWPSPSRGPPPTRAATSCCCWWGRSRTGCGTSSPTRSWPWPSTRAHVRGPRRLPVRGATPGRHASPARRRPSGWPTPGSCGPRSTSRPGPGRRGAGLRRAGRAQAGAVGPDPPLRAGHHAVPGRQPGLVEGVARVGELSLPVGDLPSMRAATRARLDELIAQNPEHTPCCASWSRRGSRPSRSTTPVRASDLPSGDELMAELEQFSPRPAPGRLTTRPSLTARSTGLRSGT